MGGGERKEKELKRSRGTGRCHPHKDKLGLAGIKGWAHTSDAMQPHPLHFLSSSSRRERCCLELRPFCQFWELLMLMFQPGAWQLYFCFYCLKTFWGCYSTSKHSPGAIIGNGKVVQWGSWVCCSTRSMLIKGKSRTSLSIYCFAYNYTITCWE